MSIGVLLFSLSEAIESVGGYTTEPVVHGQCDAKPTVIFPATEHCHYPCRLYSFTIRGG